MEQIGIVTFLLLSLASDGDGDVAVMVMTTLDPGQEMAAGVLGSRTPCVQSALAASQASIDFTTHRNGPQTRSIHRPAAAAARRHVTCGLRAGPAAGRGPRVFVARATAP